MSELDCAAARLTPIPAVAFPITLIHYSRAGLPVRIDLGHPITEDRYVYPLRKGQEVLFRAVVPSGRKGRIQPSMCSAQIDSVGEHVVWFDYLTFYTRWDLWRNTPVRDGQMLRLSMVVLTPSA